MTDQDLPEFAMQHTLVAFHRGDSDEQMIALHTSMSDEEREAQERLLDLASENDSGYVSRDVVVVRRPEDADGITSNDPTVFGPKLEAMHRPIIDLDMSAALIPSTTPGHFHLYIDKLLTWEKYAELLLALSSAGIVEEGYVSACLDRGYSSVRLPWVKKGQHGGRAE